MKVISTYHNGILIKQNSKKGIWLYCLDANFTVHIPALSNYPFSSQWLEIDGSGTVTITNGYKWDGCTPKFKIFDLGYIGTPDGTVDTTTEKPKTYYASLVHDALYQYYGSHGIPRCVIDKVFYSLLKKAKFSCALIYYIAVRVFGGIFFIGKTIIHKKVANNNQNFWTERYP